MLSVDVVTLVHNNQIHANDVSFEGNAANGKCSDESDLRIFCRVLYPKPNSPLLCDVSRLAARDDDAHRVGNDFRVSAVSALLLAAIAVPLASAGVVFGVRAAPRLRERRERRSVEQNGTSPSPDARPRGRAVPGRDRGRRHPP